MDFFGTFYLQKKSTVHSCQIVCSVEDLIVAFKFYLLNPKGGHSHKVLTLPYVGPCILPEIQLVKKIYAGKLFLQKKYYCQNASCSMAVHFKK